MSDFLSHLFANHFLLKLVLTPVIISVSTLVSRRWGESIGGLMIGLPLTSAPVSVFFALEQGVQFADHAALSAILGLIPVVAFSVSYVLAARTLRWIQAALVGIGAYLAAVVCMSMLAPSVLLDILLVPLALIAGLLILGKPETEIKRIVTTWWDIPLRMLIATTILVLITTGASFLGSKWSGLLSPFPIFTFVMAFFTHSQGGSAAVGRFIRGVIRGLFGYLVFFLVVSQLVSWANLVLVYSLATCAALLVNGLSLWAEISPFRTPQSAK